MLSVIAFLFAASWNLPNAQATTAPPGVRFRLAESGDLLGWLVSGPYPNPGAPQGIGTGFETDALGGEGTADPSEGQSTGSRPWRFATADVPHGLDLKAFFRTDASGIAYCFTELESPDDREVEMRFGSDDGAKLFLNGEQIFSHEVKRGLKRDEEHVTLRLRKGENRLLFKVEQYDGGWGLTARLVNAPGVVESLRLSPQIQDAIAPIRKLAGTGGGVDLETWRAYQEDRRTAQTFLAGMRDRARSPGMLDEALQSSNRAVNGQVPSDEAFNAVLGRSVKKIAGTYEFCRKPLLDWAQHPGPLIPDPLKNEDYISILKGGHYFAHPHGTPFIPISLNHNPDWPDLIESYPLNRRYDPKVTDRWFAKLQANGVDVVRLMVETPPSGNLEEKIGVFRPEHVIWLDNIFLAARRHGIKLWITPYDTFWMSLRADASPYWKANGGLIDKPIDFLTKPALIEAQKRRMRFLIDRYGNTGTVFAWEIMNEIDLWWNATPEQIRDWEQPMAAYVRSYERQKWGRNHLIAMSMATAEPKGLNAETEFRSKDLDFATMHLYLGVSKTPGPGQAVQAGIDYAKGVTYALSQIQDDRPAMDGESGPIDRWIQDSKLDDEVFHQMSWRHLMAGGAGSGTRWPYRQPHELSDGMLETLRSMRAFCDGVDWKAMTGHVRLTETGFETGKGALGWSSTQSQVAVPAGTGGIFDVRKATWIWQGNGPATVPIPSGTEIAFWSAKP